MRPLPADYAERVYAGVLGKIIGVYLGRPVEGWSHARILSQLGPVRGYVHDRLGQPLVVIDDDISGTFTFLRALPDHGGRLDLTPEQIGQTWLNYLVEKRTVLWWGGVGLSTEHTAYVRLKAGIPAPRSGSIGLNGRTVAEQIGAQIFIDGWGMLAPGDPDLAADLARRAASVSHDGEAIHAAQVVAGMEALAFVEGDIGRLLQAGLRLIPRDSIIARLIQDLREWHAAEPDWLIARRRLEEKYGYDKYGGSCHVVPNHGVIVLGLLYGEGDFSRSLEIAVTAGWDTDCNAGNLGCLLGLRGGLEGLGARVDWRGPLMDRLFLPSADGGRAVSDAVIETGHVVNAALALRAAPPWRPKAGARFHFELPGAVQGFRADSGRATLENVPGHSQAGARALALRWETGAPGRVAASTPTFIQPDELNMAGYELMASPTLYPGQTVRAALSLDPGCPEPLPVRLCLFRYKTRRELERVPGPQAVLKPGEDTLLEWRLPDESAGPIARAGVEIDAGEAPGAAYLDWLGWDGEPDLVFPSLPADTYVDTFPWRRAWVDAVDHFNTGWPEPYTLIQNQGTGLAIVGAREWRDYSFQADARLHLLQAGGIAVRVQGLRRYYALLLEREGRARLVRMLEGETVLAETGFAWELDSAHRLRLEARGGQLAAWIDGRQVFEVSDPGALLDGGAVALVCREGRLSADRITIQPVLP